MKKVLLSSVFLLVMAAGCSSEEQDELLTYLNDDIESAGELEQEYLSDYEEVAGANYTDDETMYTTLEESVIPKQEEVLDKVKAIDISDDEIAEAHDIYIDAVEIQHEDFLQVMEAIEEQDPSLTEEANDKLDKGNDGMLEYQSKIEDMADERNVELDEQEAE